MNVCTIEDPFDGRSSMVGRRGGGDRKGGVASLVADCEKLNERAVHQ